MMLFYEYGHGGLALGSQQKRRMLLSQHWVAQLMLLMACCALTH